MKRTRITRDVLALALRHLRISGRLTQKEVSRRAALFEDLGFGRLLESQISDFERGRTLPSLGSLLNLLAGCSEDGKWVDFGVFQRTLELIADHESAGGFENTVETGVPMIHQNMVKQIIDELSARWSEQIQGVVMHQKDELAELRTRLVRTEEMMASLLTGAGHSANQAEGQGGGHSEDRDSPF